MKSPVKLLNFNDDSEWLKWRSTGLGGSDAPVVVGLSKFRSAFDLFLEKTGRKRPQTQNKAMKHGVSNEAKARDAYTLQTGNFMPPANLESPEREFLHASLDGYDPDSELILEVKAPWDITDHISAKEGTVPEHYYAQVQHCMAVAGVSKAHYFSWFGDGDQVLIEVTFDDRYWTTELLPAEEQFWGWVQKNDYPLPQGKEERDDADYLAVERDVWEALGMRTVADERLRRAKAKIQRMAKAQVTTGKLLEATYTYYKPTVIKEFKRSESLNLSFRRIK